MREEKKKQRIAQREKSKCNRKRKRKEISRE